MVSIQYSEDEPLEMLTIATLIKNEGITASVFEFNV